MKPTRTVRTVKLATLVTMAMIVVVLLGSIRLGTWITQSTEVLVVNNDPVPVKPLELDSGQKVSAEIDYCKKQKIEGKTRVFLVGETGGNKPELVWPNDSGGPGCQHLAEVPVSIPGNIPTDTYHIVFEVTYKVNPLKGDTLVVFRSRSFKVDNPKLNQGDAKVQL